jgi:hypothetical protein
MTRNEYAVFTRPFVFVVQCFVLNFLLMRMQ